MAEIQEHPRFTYVEPPYEEYARYYREMDVFVSLSSLEGGPIPMIEAMLCDVVPVMSNTGFAPDLISHGDNGYLFDVGAPLSHVEELIDLACELRRRVHTSEGVKELSWENFARKILAEIEPTK
jgi:glycosyltransferase involved in cell wall biosynthesis